MVDGTKFGEREERRLRRWKVGGALCALVVTVGGIAAIAAIDRHEKRRMTASAPVAMALDSPDPTAATATVEAMPPAVATSTSTAPAAVEEKVAAFAKVDDVSVAVPVNDATPVDHVAKADALKTSGDAKGELAELREALDLKPDDVTILGRIAKLDDGDVGEQALEKIVKLSKTDVDAPKELAKRRLAHDDAKGALPMAIEACRRAPKSWEAWELEGRAFMAEGKLGQAIDAFRKSTAQADAPSYPFNNLGLALLRAGREDEALTALNTAVERGPVESYMMNNLGLAYEKGGRLDEAEVAFLGALELKSDYVKAQVNLERVGNEKDALAKKEADDKAKEAKTAASEVDPTTAGGETTAQSTGAPAPTTPLHGG